MKKLTPEEKRIILLKGTEPAYSGKYYQFDENGDYVRSFASLLFKGDLK